MLPDGAQFWMPAYESGLKYPFRKEKRYIACALECAGVIRNALECARGFSVLSPGLCKCAEVFDLEQQGHDGIMHQSVLEGSGMRWSWAQFGHKPVGLLLNHPIDPA